MSETPEQIEQEVELARARLTQDLNALQYRVKTMTDWRWHFRRQPWTFLGVIFGAAVLVGWLSMPAREKPKGLLNRARAKRLKFR